MENNEKGFFKNHGDTVAIIAVNIAIGAILVSMWISNCSSINTAHSRIDAANARMDTLHTMFYDLLKEVKK